MIEFDQKSKTEFAEVLEAISELPYFLNFNPDLLGLIAAIAIKKTYQPGEYLFLEGDPCLGLYIVQEGWLRAFKSSLNGRELVVRYVGPKEAFNEIAVLSAGINYITVEALELAQIIIIPRQAMLNLIDRYPELAKAVIQSLTARILRVMNMLVDMSLHTVENRLARFLLDQATSDAISRKKWATQAAIASHLGTVPVVINRAFRAFVEDGLIELGRERIHILNRSELERIATALD